MSTSTRQALDVASLRSMIGRTLNKAHLTRSEWLASSRVRGWGNWTGGYDFDGGAMYEGTVNTGLFYRAGSWSKSDGPEVRERMLGRYERVLREAGFNVDRMADGEKLLVWVEAKP